MTSQKDSDFPRFSKSCKQFRKKNALAFYILILDPDSKELKHREMLRIVNKSGEYYLFPHPLHKSDFHFSYHKSGRFHWVLDRKHHLPLQQECDFREAFQDYLRIQATYGWIVGFCVACGPGVDKTSLRGMLELLSRYVPIDFRSEEALSDIYQRKHVTQWNRIADSRKSIPTRPLATGLMLVEMKETPGILHTLNVWLAVDDSQVARRTRKRWLPNILFFKKKKKAPIKLVLYEKRTMVEISDIEKTHVVIM